MLRLLIDENLNHRILRGLLRRLPELDYELVHDVGLKGVDDPTVLTYAATERRVVVTHDLRTMPKHGYERVQAGLGMSGIIAFSDTLPIGQAIDDLWLTVECCGPDELDKSRSIPSALKRNQFSDARLSFARSS